MFFYAFSANNHTIRFSEFRRNIASTYKLKKNKFVSQTYHYFIHCTVLNLVDKRQATKSLRAVAVDIYRKFLFIIKRTIAFVVCKVDLLIVQNKILTSKSFKCFGTEIQRFVFA